MIRFFILLSSILTLVFAGCNPSPNADTVGIDGSFESRPNILFLLTDDQRDGSFAGMGHPFIKTPNVDRLLAQSIRFSNTYIAEPVCSPSRVSLFTGMYERVHGVGFTSSYQLTEEQWARSYPALLRRSGYYTGFIGKFGVEYYTFKGNAANKFDYWWGHDGWTKFLPKNFDQPSTLPYHRAKEDLITPIMGEAMTEFLDSLPDDKPFCLSVSLNVPHGSQTTSMYPDYEDWQRMTRPANENQELKGTQFYDSLYRDIDIQIPNETATDPYRFIPKFILDQEAGRKTRTYQYNYTRESNLEHHIRYNQTISGLDHEIGELISNLEARGLMDNTVIIYGSDHGLLMGEYGMGGKSLLYDLASKIPCFIYDPRLPQSRRGGTVNNLVSSLDITKTILDYAGVDPLEFMDGLSLRPLILNQDGSWRQELFLESLYTGRDNPFQEGIRLGKWKYIRMYDGVQKYSESDLNFSDRSPEFEMLFDLTTDPAEMNNLIQATEHSEILETLRAKTDAYSMNLNKRRKAFKQTVAIQDR